MAVPYLAVQSHLAAGHVESDWKGKQGTSDVYDNRILEKCGFHHNVIDTVNIINLFST